ncbi:hypothetical protein FRC12_019728 [Ceratobasidium sp. 428]|nr:hypothetical protein FRC12_019728 [Ceratobasidium sp. 428]
MSLSVFITVYPSYYVPAGSKKVTIDVEVKKFKGSLHQGFSREERQEMNRTGIAGKNEIVVRLSQSIQLVLEAANI